MLGFSKIPDHKILERIQQGDEKVLVYLFKEHRGMVTNFVLKNNGTEDAVDDLLQESIIALWKKCTTTEFLLTAKLSTYLMSIVKNLWYKHLRKEKKFTKIAPQERIERAGSVTMNVDLDKSIIVQMVDELDDTCRRLLSYFYFDGFSNIVIAEKLGFSNADSVKSKKYQCFKKLQSRVTSQYKKEDFI